MMLMIMMPSCETGKQQADGQETGGFERKDVLKKVEMK